MFHSTNPENAAIIERLRERLSALPIGGILSHSDVASVAGRDYESAYDLLQRAISKAEAELGCIFYNVRTVGTKRLESKELPGVGVHYLHRLRKMSRRGKKRLDRINVNSLSLSEQRDIIAQRAQLGAVALVSDTRISKNVAVVVDPTRPIPPQNILDMFRAESR